MFLNDSVISYISTALDTASLRHDVIASNIANADTPNYKGKHISFKNILDRKNGSIALKTTDSRHIKDKNTAAGCLIKSDNNEYLKRNDNNNVNLDTEMVLLAKNTVLTNALTAFEKYKFNQYKDIIALTRNA